VRHCAFAQRGPSKHPDPPSDKTIWTEDTCWTKISTEAQDSESLDETTYKGSKNDKTGIYALEKADIFTCSAFRRTRAKAILGNTVPGSDEVLRGQARFLIVDPPRTGRRLLTLPRTTAKP